MKVRAYIYQCRDLPAADKTGTSDPYVQAWDVSPNIKGTMILYETLNPIFYQTLELEYDVGEFIDT